MTGAIEFIRKTKAICKSKSTCRNCPALDFCVGCTPDNINESDLVRKVMDYRLEDKK